MTTFPEVREALPAFEGWGLECVEAAKGSDGVAYVGSRYDDDDLAIILVVDTGQYYQDDKAMPLAKAVSAACTNTPAMLAHIDAQAAEIERLREAEDALRRALEVIAVGDASDPQKQAAEELMALGYWQDTPEARAALEQTK